MNCFSQLKKLKVKKSLRQDNTNEYASIKTKPCNKLSANYINIVAESNDRLSVTVVHKSTEAKSECYQLSHSVKLLTC